MDIGLFSSADLKEVFDRYSDTNDDDFAFSRTRVPVNLARTGEDNLISRSQAKRLVARLEKFREIILDFKGVEKIGQAFADEVFRVFQNEHPETVITAVNANPEIERMIRRALTERAQSTQ